MTPAHLAGHFENFDSFNLLMEHGADIYNIRNEENISPLEELVRQDHLDLLKCVYKPTKDKSKESGVFGLIHHAAGRENSECLKMFLDIGISPNEPCNMIDKA